MERLNWLRTSARDSTSLLLTWQRELTASRRISSTTASTSLQHTQQANRSNVILSNYTDRPNTNKAIVDSRLRPQSCCHLANCIEMQEIVDCKLDANNIIMNNSTYPNNPQEAIFVPVQKCPYHVTFDLHLDLEHTLDACWPGLHLVKVWWWSGHLSARRSDLRKSLQTDRRRTLCHCISSFLEWANNNEIR